MTNLIKFLQGYKSYIIAILIGIMAALKYLGTIDEQTFITLFALLTGGGVASLGAKINRYGNGG